MALARARQSKTHFSTREAARKEANSRANFAKLRSIRALSSQLRFDQRHPSQQYGGFRSNRAAEERCKESCASPIAHGSRWVVLEAVLRVLDLDSLNDPLLANAAPLVDYALNSTVFASMARTNTQSSNPTSATGANTSPRRFGVRCEENQLS
jgi:hypothetical protein